jgi:hypothetical protein
MANDNYNMNASKITFETGNKVEFDFPISEILIFKNSYIILLDILNGVKYNSNIFCLDFTGKIKWQINNFEMDQIRYCPFISLEIVDFKLISYTWCGFRYTIDPQTGKIIERIFTK